MEKKSFMDSILVANERVEEYKIQKKRQAIVKV